MQINKILSPQGLYWQNNFLTPEEIVYLWQWTTTLNWQPVPNRMGNVGKQPRFAFHLGFSYPYSGGRSAERFKEKTTPFTPEITYLKQKIEAYLGGRFQFDQCILNYYPVGQKISAHIDSEYYGEVIACLTLYHPEQRVTPATMHFKAQDARLVPMTFDLPTPQGSLYLMTGASRHQYTHEMYSTDGMRVSITFRKVLGV